VNNKLEEMWKEAVRVYFKVLSHHGPTKEAHTKLQSLYPILGSSF